MKKKGFNWIFYGGMFMSSEKIARRFKGKSIIKSVDDYVVVDIETTGFSIGFDEIVEIGAVQVENGEIVSEFEQLIKPINKTVSGKVTEHTGITNEMLVDKPTISDVLPAFKNFIGNNVLIVHNNAFDINMLYDVFLEYDSNEPLINDFIDTLNISRRVFANEKGHRLEDMVKRCGVDEHVKHRALSDALNTQKCYEHMKALPCFAEIEKASVTMRSRKPKYTEATLELRELVDIIKGIINDRNANESHVDFLIEWLHEHSFLQGNYPFDQIEKVLADYISHRFSLQQLIDSFNSVVSDELQMDKSDIEEIEGMKICLTGDFAYGDKKKIEESIEFLGGIISPNTTSKTNMVIVGDLGSPSWTLGNYGNKIKKALELQSKGNSIKIYPEKALVDYIEKGTEINVMIKENKYDLNVSENVSEKSVGTNHCLDNWESSIIGSQEIMVLPPNENETVVYFNKEKEKLDFLLKYDMISKKQHEDSKLKKIYYYSGDIPVLCELDGWIPYSSGENGIAVISIGDKLHKINPFLLSEMQKRGLVGFLNRLENLFSSIILDEELPPNSIRRKINTKKESAIEKSLGSICFFEPDYCVVPNSNLTKESETSIVNILSVSDGIVLRVKRSIFNELNTPDSATIKSKNLDNDFIEVSFSLSDKNLIEYIKEIILLRYRYYESKASSFGCCSRFNDCSDKKRCVHENKLYSKSCQYRKKLDAGKNFYGKNRNI